MMHNPSDDEIEVTAEPDTDARPRDAEEKIQKQKSEIERLERERREYLEGWQRAKADFINYKKDEAKRAEELLRFAAGSLVTEILVVLDSFDLALGGTADRGMHLIRAQLEDILRRHGLEPVNAALGDAFSPERHEAIGEEESDRPEGTITSVLQKGYMLHGRLIRPARVKISKGSNGM